ncbi:subclass B3 metallo-beta-lactamase [Parvularcula sp. IMCC14364]|uniref:subclass B3 metallo-beta-lactamase n=1 Tax=Parvularcula sp. IMCC14364 TaxID=3067902 RepID=UPI002741E5E8|nr:subclass B3 metallo-beta-lactamase [Parvularcula sp. IMCC14364]
MSRFYLCFLSLILFLVSATASMAQNEDLIAQNPDFRSLQPTWFQSAEPFRIIGDIHFVGVKGLAIFFIPTAERHIVIDGGMPQNAPLIAENIRTLGYDPADIKILLNTHAHFDHSGGLAAMKEMSGAQLIASAGDRPSLESGTYLGYEDVPWLNAPPVQVDRVIRDGEIVTLGGVSLTAHLTPGHTRGCTSWTLTVQEEEQEFDALIFCSATVALNRLVGPPQYESIVQDYRQTFEKTRDWQPDVFLANHPDFFSMKAKREKQQDGDQLAFVDKEEFSTFIARMEEWFDAALAKQTSSMTSADAD